ncbi:MAG: protoheme IX farnesyltransferase [Ignavibacteria bacterium]|nr:protoheme IX farnesyltransferase [Ignavibacteria bacterium]
MKHKFKILADLTKLRITLFVTLTTAVGFIAAAGELNSAFVAPVVGILILACGSAIVNHIQERNTDALMNRTKGRPIPSGEISVKSATIIALILICTGTLILYFGAGLLAMGLALLNLIWYNAFYTPLKKKSSLAILPGSLVGAIPPAVGWVAAGGYIFDKEIIIISAFFFIWQIPHFWLLMISFDHEYKQAGFPTITKFFNKDQFARIIYVWIVATVVTGLLIPFFNVVEFSFMYYSLLAAGILLTWSAAKLLSRQKENISFRLAFKEINLFALFVLLVISVDKLII